MVDTSIQPFRVNVRDEELAELRRRIAATRWPSKELVGDRSQGVQLATIQELARYWATDYDWRKCEARLNALPQFTSEIDGVDIHFIHVKSSHENAMPLIMTHGWPGSVIELLETVGPLTGLLNQIVQHHERIVARDEEHHVPVAFPCCREDRAEELGAVWDNEHGVHRRTGTLPVRAA
jgi:Epoxide hydrolase N terminus